MENSNFWSICVNKLIKQRVDHSTKISVKIEKLAAKYEDLLFEASAEYSDFVVN